MGKVEEAQEILSQMGLPKPQQNEMSGLTLLALCGLGPDDNWSAARRISLGISKGIMVFIKEHYDRMYAPNTRETFRRQVLHQFVQARLVDYNPDEPNLPTNSPRAHYALTNNALVMIKAYGSRDWKRACRTFLKTHGSLREKYGKRKSRRLVPVQLPDGSTFELSPGEHNVVQAAVVEQFIPRFAPGARLMYLGDTAKKNLYLDKNGLQALGIDLTDQISCLMSFSTTPTRRGSSSLRR